MNFESATTHEGRAIQFVPDCIGAGLMKDVYFTEDKSSVICFFRSSDDPVRLDRLRATLTKYNPTRESETGDYWKHYYCWITDIVTRPRLGVVAPAYPPHFRFSRGAQKGREKSADWFLLRAPRQLLAKAELGTWQEWLLIAIRLARAVRRLHQAGLAHSDLSPKNVLVDPLSGRCVVIDTDSLVVPGLFPPEVIGTPGYIAPEVLATHHLPHTHDRRRMPSVLTDLHALAVLIYQYLFMRHPLIGPRTFPAASAEEQVRLEMGERALFIEHPSDGSNRPANLAPSCSVVGRRLAALFHRAFVAGLHSPDDRPSAVEWERELCAAWDRLHPCPNRRCRQKAFVLHDAAAPICPFCNARVRNPVPILELRHEVHGRPGSWQADGSLVVYNDGKRAQGLFKWHAMSAQSRAERADPKRQAYFVFHENQWLLVNEQLPSLTTHAGVRVPPGQAVSLRDGYPIRLSQDHGGRIALVHLATTPQSA